MSPNDHSNFDNEDSLLTDVGENYQYLKTIITNRVEILKLEFIQHISDIASKLILSIIIFFTMAIVILLFIAALIVFLASVVGSYLYAILIVNAGVIILAILLYIIIKPSIAVILEKKMSKLKHEKPSLS